MSGLSTRNRIITVVSSAAIIAPFALMGGSAQAVEVPIVGTVPTPVDGLVAGVVPGGAAAGPLGIVTGLTGGALAGTGLNPLGTATTAAADPTKTTDALLGQVLGTGVLKTVTSVAGLEQILKTVTDLVDVDKILKTVTDLVKNVTGALDLGDLLGDLPVKINTPSVKGAHAKDQRAVVRAGTLPKTGGNADMTAILLCAGLAVAGTGVTMVTRRRNSLLGA